jgi:hypothetical protein
MVLLHGKTLNVVGGKTMTFRFKYSSVDNFLTEMHAEATKNGVNFPSYHGDFLPYTGLTKDDEEYSATGQYSHRP